MTASTTHPSLALTLCLIALLSGCKNPLKAVGEDPADDAVLSETFHLEHLADALDDEAATVADLFDPELRFPSAPDPDDLLDVQFINHESLMPDGSGTPLDILTFNAGLLGRTYVVWRVEVPELETRRERMGELVFAEDADIVFLQEVWEVDDAEALQEAAEAAGYRVWRPDRRKPQRETGLFMAAKEDLIDSEGPFTVAQYDAQWRSENFPGPNIKRGWLHASFTMADGTEVHLIDTHLTPFYDQSLTRQLQVRELGLEIAALPDDALVLVGGDFNAGWYYRDDTWTDIEGSVSEGWWNNPVTPALMQHYGGLQDLASLAPPAYLGEVEIGDQVPTDPSEDWVDTPFGDGALCREPELHTATDCNSLYRESYAGTEYPARMDLLFVRDGTERLRARGRELVFTEALDWGEAGEFELSDHYGQRVSVELID